MHNFYLTRHMHFEQFSAVKKLALKCSNHEKQGIELVAVDLMSVDTMTRADKLDMATREDAAFLFLLKGFVDVDAASLFMDNFMDMFADVE